MRVSRSWWAWGGEREGVCMGVGAVMSACEQCVTLWVVAPQGCVWVCRYPCTHQPHLPCWLLHCQHSF